MSKNNCSLKIETNKFFSEINRMDPLHQEVDNLIIVYYSIKIF